MTIDKKYLIFLQNKDWYYWDRKEWKYKLTDKATEEAKKSYEEFYKKWEA